MANQAKAVESPSQSTDVASTGAAETGAPEIVPQRDAATFLPDAKLILMAALTDSPEHLVSTHSLKKTMRKTIPPNLVDEVVWNLRQDEQSDWRHRGASFYTKDAYEQYQRAEVQEAEETADDATIEADAIDEVAEKRKSRNRQEEHRMTAKVAELLETLYEHNFDRDSSYVFDVFGKTPGGKFCNPDLIAFHWRTGEIAESIAVEAKLIFNAEAVQQAMNYCRFASRVWIAVAMPSEWRENAPSRLRALEPKLFDYVTEQGLGIIGCRKSYTYDCSVIQWPRLQHGTALDKAWFEEAYNQCFQEAELTVGKKRAGRVI